MLDTLEGTTCRQPPSLVPDFFDLACSFTAWPLRDYDCYVTTSSLRSLEDGGDMHGVVQSRPQEMSMTSDGSIPGRASTEAPRILAIEDDSAVQKVLKRLFETEGYGVDLAKDGLSGLKRLCKRRPSAIVLDLTLPDISGLEVCQQITRLAPGLPVIVLSAKAEVADKIVLLEMGASDYVTKPFSPRELLARVRVALRRADLRSAQVAGKNVFRFDDVAVNIPNAEVTRGGCSVFLRAAEFKILVFMIRNQRRVVPREELLKEVLGYQNCSSTRTVDTHILKLRQKLEKNSSDPVHFRTVHGVGYKFVP
jgi:DNA-binding response OmpR family regulator